DMINAILIEVLGSIAENERNKIRSRQREGIIAAKNKNVKFGRPKIDTPDNWNDILKQVKAKELTASQAVKILNISRSSYYRMQNSKI
ncbi:MAG: recombinase family protein, partial [Ruminococcus sp.]|nr:recombinase family protein [Ruminococcus sp.]